MRFFLLDILIDKEKKNVELKLYLLVMKEDCNMELFISFLIIYGITNHPIAGTVSFQIWNSYSLICRVIKTEFVRDNV